MKTTSILTAFAAVIALACAVFAPQAFLPTVAAAAITGGALFITYKTGMLHALANTVTISLQDLRVHRGEIQRTAGAAITQQCCVVMKGATDLKVITHDNTAAPVGYTGEATYDSGDSVPVKLFSSGETAKFYANAAIAVGGNVYTQASSDAGQVGPTPSTTGDYWLIGQAKTAALADGDPLEVETHMPRKVKVIANASTLAQTQAAMLDGTTVIVLGS